MERGNRVLFVGIAGQGVRCCILFLRVMCPFPHDGKRVCAVVPPSVAVCMSHFYKTIPNMVRRL